MVSIVVHEFVVSRSIFLRLDRFARAIRKNTLVITYYCLAAIVVVAEN